MGKTYEAEFFVTGVVLASVIWLGVLFAVTSHTMEDRVLKTDCIQQGYAKYTVNDSGEVTFVWKTPEEIITTNQGE